MATTIILVAIHNEWAWHPKHDYWKLDGVCKENTKGVADENTEKV